MSQVKAAYCPLCRPEAFPNPEARATFYREGAVCLTCERQPKVWKDKVIRGVRASLNVPTCSG